MIINLESWWERRSAPTVPETIISSIELVVLIIFLEKYETLWINEGSGSIEIESCFKSICGDEIWCIFCGSNGTIDETLLWVRAVGDVTTQLEM